MGTKAELVDCVRARMIQTWPQGKLAAAHCTGRSDPFEELDCITMTSLGIDLAILGGESDIASFVDRLGSDNGDATSHAATAFGKVVWDACPDGAGASKCRLDETLRKLELGDAELARCAPLKDDRKTVSCLMLSRVRSQVDAATAQISATAP